MTSEGTLPNLFLHSQHHLDTIAIYGHEKKRKLPVFLMNIDTKFLDRKLANQIQKDMKRITHQDQMGFIQGTSYAN